MIFEENTRLCQPVRLIEVIEDATATPTSGSARTEPATTAILKKDHPAIAEAVRETAAVDLGER
ncbi:hypothetical protein [Streptomyces sp. SP18CS02]|uniref:hypothetical protein n=1 Tax=Streptomyces sp. SP18CS02 TaxID=3002531 RepID=UPI002E7AA324|nr:hypothetical protein [Streptomyces sp. SP18CS02]MEE1753108.1 hypothetical protein [Streptomyces sp. SP18CS02]